MTKARTTPLRAMMPSTAMTLTVSAYSPQLQNNLTEGKESLYGNSIGGLSIGQNNLPEGNVTSMTLALAISVSILVDMVKTDVIYVEGDMIEVYKETIPEWRFLGIHPVHHVVNTFGVMQFINPCTAASPVFP
jgi:hypothetical protein